MRIVDLFAGMSYDLQRWNLACAFSQPKNTSLTILLPRVPSFGTPLLYLCSVNDCKGYFFEFSPNASISLEIERW